MKNRLYMLFVLVGLLGTFTVSSAYAQRHGGGGGHFGGGARVGGGGHFSGGNSGRVYSSQRMYSPRMTAPINRGYYHGYYHGYRPVYGHGFYGRPYYRYYRPYYNPFFPPLGLYVSTLPFGYFSLGASFGPMYYYGGTYYQSTGDNRGYKVVEAPVGAAVPNLPDGAQEITVDGNTYYELNGTYYQETMTDNGRRYIVVGKNGKIGDKTVTITDQGNNQGNNNTPNNDPGNNTDNNGMISQLPDNCRTVNINGQQYFLSPDGMYYQSVLNSDNSIAGYKVVGKMNADN